MLLLSKLGAQGLRKMLEDQQRAEPFGEDTGGLAGQVRQRSALSRKGMAAAKLLVDRQRHRHLLEAHVYSFYESQNVREGIAKHVDVLKNLQRMVTNRIALCYHRPPSRRISTVSDKQASLFNRAYLEARTDLCAERWNRYALFLGVVHVLPRYENGRLRWITVTPDHSDVLFDPVGEEEPSILVYESQSHGAKWIAVDAERWWWIDKDWRVLIDEEHFLGMRPWVPIRWQEPPEADYWDQGHAEDLYQGTLELARVYAHARWIRKHWAKKLTTVHTGDNVNTPANQNMSANDPVVFEGSGQVSIEVHDMEVSMEHFQAEMREIVESVLEQYGLPAEVVDFDASKPSPDRLIKHDALAKIRDQQVKQFERFELELALRANAILRRHGRTAITDEQLQDGFRVRFARMTFADHPKDRMATYHEQLKLGLTNPYEIFMLENPGTTFDEALEEVDENVELRAKFYEQWIANNMNLDPADDLRTAAQLNGKVGGQSKQLPGEEPDQQADEDNEQ